jgi:hypothetical protein
VSPFRFLSTAQQSSPAVTFADHFREVLHRRWIMLTSPSTPSWLSFAAALLASCAVLKQRQVFNHTGRAETKSLLSFLF